MEETISTTETTSTEQTTQENVSNVQPDENTSNQTIEQTTQEPVNNEEVTTENVEEGKEQTQKQENKTQDWEKIAKDNQASFTRVSQELAELKKQIADSKPKVVTDGKINPQFEMRYKYDVDNKEFLAYDALSRQLEPEMRAEVEKLLAEAKTLYNPSNKRAYETKLNQIKDYFRADIVEQIALEKQKLYGNLDNEFNKMIQADREERAKVIEQRVETMPELKALITPDSENFSEEVFGIVKTMFDLTGDVDIEATQNAISKIKELGVKEYLAKQKAEAEKKNATVPSGEGVLQKTVSTIPTADEMRANPELYRKAVKKFGMEKVDAVFMKG